VLQPQCGLGFTYRWAKENFKDKKDKNTFFEKLGRLLEPKREDDNREFNDSSKPQQILNKFE
jgi:hypothetical protein